MSRAAIEIRGLTRRYGKTEAVNGLNLTVRAGGCYGFFGRNGAGKTTTIKCLLNLLRPDGRQGLTRSQGARRRRVADLIHQLPINRFAGFEIDLEQHSS